MNSTKFFTWSLWVSAGVGLMYRVEFTNGWFGIFSFICGVAFWGFYGFCILPHIRTPLKNQSAESR